MSKPTHSSGFYGYYRRLYSSFSKIDSVKPYLIKSKPRKWTKLSPLEWRKPVYFSGKVYTKLSRSSLVLYLNLKRPINPFITDELETQIDTEDNLVLQEDLLHYQQDCVPPHYYLPVQQVIWQKGRKIPRFKSFRLLSLRASELRYL